MPLDYKLRQLHAQYGPELPDKPKEAFDLLINYHAAQVFITHKQYYIGRYNPILHKLDKDDFLQVEKVNTVFQYKKLTDVNFYSATFEGRFFKLNGGYQNKINLENADADRRATEAQRNIYQYWVTVSIGISTGVAAAYYFFGDSETP